MATLEPTARPLAIQLTAFSYDLDYEPAPEAEIKYKIHIQHRMPPSQLGDLMDVLVTIVYRAPDQEEPVLQASCLTSYILLDLPKAANPDGEGYLFAIPDTLGQRMTVEAIIHARAVLAQQTAGTPFSSIHIALNPEVQRASVPASA